MAWKDTLNLPDTAFPMKANLVQREPEILARWTSEDLYAQIRVARRGSEVYVFHDGPPYANGEGHVGTFRNKILKDVVVRYATMRGRDAPFVPGWDCHGLPIEHNVMKDLGPKAAATAASEVRRLCRAYAEKFVAVQRDNFARFGVSADWANPYLTMNPQYEAGILSVFADIAEKGYVARGLRSIHWCVTCKTALAEAELEYAPETSSSIHVRFRMTEPDLERLGGRPTAVVIWTTTPWTLPANVAVAVHPKLQYAVVEHDGPDGAQRVIVALALVTKYLAAVGATDHTIPLVVSGETLKGAKLHHPFLDRIVPVVTADYVSEEDGTGCVHTAPGHGADDFATGKREGLQILCPVGPDGLYTAEVGLPELVGTHVFKADEKVVHQLRERGALAAFTQLTHEYPHCWRCKRPVIFRATDQWFVLVDHVEAGQAKTLRERALEACEDVGWFPAWGKQRMTGMLKTRPDWCISRQRTWGVPIPALYCESCGKVTTGDDHVRVIRHARDLVAQEGADAWFVGGAERWVPEGLRCSCGGTSWRRETDIFDVWFEAGSSWKSVCTEQRGLAFPADVYLESQDQHRGWFQTSLLPAMAAEGKSPFRNCVTNGYFTDDTGDKVSKSKGGMKDLSAEVLTKQIGADITRLFFVSGNYFEDIAISRRLFDPASEQYRKVRNTFRYLLGAVSGYAPESAPSPEGELLFIDRWVMAAMDDVTSNVTAAYDVFDYCKASQILREFMDADLSAFYFDLVKDRLYCAAAASREGRSCRTALAHLASVLIRLWAPLLPFTCEEAWGHLPVALRGHGSVHLADWPVAGEPAEPLVKGVGQLRLVRTEIQRRVDPMRKAGDVGSGQDVGAAFSLTEGEDFISPIGIGADEIDEILGVAESRPETDAAATLAATDFAWLRLAVFKTGLPRCERCRRRRADAAVRSGGRDPLCPRCEAWRSAESATA